ncbi:MAG: response regulator [Pseudanabaenaceae cyanobacterium SKYGB_i_bin29]|nr:response regulator [Pseudanabaenaceae cyanobacterium SKYG29]MDW8422142.1 response regulator [Pseudanabaenaceae cyanobacterium SKYGB_i_bin29]
MNTSLPSNRGQLRPGEPVRDASLLILLAATRVMVRSSGVLHVESPHFRWKLLLQRGGIVLMEEEEQAIATFNSKLRNHGIRAASERLTMEQHPTKMVSLSLVLQLYKRCPEETKESVRDIIMDDLLALFLEDKYTFIWQPYPNIPADLPVWQFNTLEAEVNKEVKRWQDFEHVRHPYQKVQLLDAGGLLARVGNDNFPLFAKVTTGQHRISEIANQFKQPIWRTAVLLDKLATNKIVEILPLKRLSGSAIEQLRGVEAAPPEPEATGPRVFVVDDSPVLLRQFRDLLTSWGYQVRLTENALDATQQMLAFNPAVVFLDINMPGLNGFELIKQIRRQPSLANTPLVLVTAENNMANNVRAKWANCKFIGKPRSPEDAETFRTQLRDVLREVAPLPTDILI